MLLRLYNGYTWHRRTGTQLVLGFVLGDGRLTIQTLGTLAVIGCVSKLPQLHTVFVMFREKTAHIHTPTLACSAPALAEAFTFGLALALALPCASGHVCGLSTLKCQDHNVLLFLATLCGSWWAWPFPSLPLPWLWLWALLLLSLLFVVLWHKTDRTNPLQAPGHGDQQESK